MSMVERNESSVENLRFTSRVLKLPKEIHSE